MAVNLASLINKAGFRVSLGDILSNPTIKKLAGAVNDRKISPELEQDIYEERLLSQLQCIEKLNKGRNEKNIFLIHPLHGMVNQYKELAELLEQKYSIYGVEARGIKPGSMMAENPVRMVDDYIQQILAVQKDGGYIIGGYCNGVDIGYELVRRLESLNQSVEKLLLFDPHVLFPYHFIKRLRVLEKLPDFFRNRLIRLYDKKYKKAFHLMESREKDGEANKKIGADNFSRDKFEERIDLLTRHIIPLNIIKSPILAIVAEESLSPSPQTEGPRATEEELSHMTKSEVRFVKVPGSHDTIFEKPYVEKLAEAIMNNM